MILLLLQLFNLLLDDCPMLVDVSSPEIIKDISHSLLRTDHKISAIACWKADCNAIQSKIKHAIVLNEATQFAKVVLFVQIYVRHREVVSP